MYNNKYDNRMPSNVARAHARGTLAHKLSGNWNMTYEKDMYGIKLVRREIQKHFEKNPLSGYVLEVGPTARRESNPFDKMKMLFVTDKKSKKISEFKSNKIENSQASLLTISEYLENNNMRLEHLFQARFVFGDEKLYIEHKKQMFERMRNKPDKYEHKSSIEFDEIRTDLKNAHKMLDSYIVGLMINQEVDDDFLLNVPKNTCNKMEYLYKNNKLNLSFEEVDLLIHLYIEDLGRRGLEILNKS